MDLVPIADIKNAAAAAGARLEGAKQQGSVASIDYGETNFSTMPASGIKLLLGPKQLRVNQLLLAVSKWYRRAFEMARWQIISGAVNAPIGSRGSSRVYSLSDLKVDFDLNVQMFSVDPIDDIANISIATSLGNMVSRDYKRRHILQLENPEREKEMVELEEAEAEITILRWRNRAAACIERGDDVGARIIKADILDLLEQKRLAKEAQAQQRAQQFVRQGAPQAAGQQGGMMQTPLIGGNGGRLIAQGRQNEAQEIDRRRA